MDPLVIYKPVGKDGYRGREDLRDVLCGDGVTSIGLEAFVFSSAVSIIFPRTIQRIAWNAFRRCHKLEKVNFTNVTDMETLGKFLRSLDFDMCLDAFLLLPPIIVRTPTGDEYLIEGIRIPAWSEEERIDRRESAANMYLCPNPRLSVHASDLTPIKRVHADIKARGRIPRPPRLPDLCELLKIQYPDLAGSQFELLASEPGSTDANIPISNGKGLRRFFRGELDLGSVCLLFTDSGDGEEEE